MQVTIEFDGESYGLDLDEIDVGEARTIKRSTGMSLVELQKGFTDADPDALVALYWLMMKQNGTNVNMANVNFKVVKFANAVIDAQEKAAEAEANKEAAPKESRTKT